MHQKILTSFELSQGEWEKLFIVMHSQKYFSLRFRKLSLYFHEETLNHFYPFTIENSKIYPRPQSQVSSYLKTKGRSCSSSCILQKYFSLRFCKSSLYFHEKTLTTFTLSQLKIVKFIPDHKQKK